MTTQPTQSLPEPSPEEEEPATATPGDEPGQRIQVIEAGHLSLSAELAEMWRYRDLLYFLTRREISVRYKQTALGVVWAVLQPLLTMVVFTIFLGKLAGVPSDDVPYPIFSYLGLLPWTYFSSAMSRSGMSLVANANLLTKVYFPRLLIPLAATLSALVDFVFAFVVLVVLMLFYGMLPAPSSWLLLPLVVLTALVATGLGLGLAALNVRYRDVQHAIPFLMQIWMFATPVVYPASLVPEKYRVLFALNPLTGLVNAYRAAALGRPVDFGSLGLGLIVAAVISVAGLAYFRRTERTFADVV